MSEICLWLVNLKTCDSRVQCREDGNSQSDDGGDAI